VVAACAHEEAGIGGTGASGGAHGSAGQGGKGGSSGAIASAGKANGGVGGTATAGSGGVAGTGGGGKSSGGTGGKGGTAGGGTSGSTTGGAGGANDGGGPPLGMSDCDVGGAGGGGGVGGAGGGAGGAPGIDYSLALDGNGDCVDVSTITNINILSDWTIEAWFKDGNTNYSHGRAYIMAFGNTDTDSDIPYSITLENLKLWAYIRHNWIPDVNNIDTNLTQIVSYAVPGSTSVWHHVAVTHDDTADSLTMYLDGSQVATGSAPNDSTATTHHFYIGCSAKGSPTHWLGLINDVRVWNVVRSGTEILNNYGVELECTPPGLVANWKFDEGSGSTANDSVGPHQGALVGDASFSIDNPH
jgi:hypothetical protein